MDEQEGREGRGGPNATGAQRHAYLLPCHELLHGYPSPEEEPRAVCGEIALRKVLHLELLDILHKPPGKYIVFPEIVQSRACNGRGRGLTQYSVVSTGLASPGWGWACQPCS
jgi:hypothetical protein